MLYSKSENIQNNTSLDETFDFYFQDDDFAMTLRKYSINLDGSSSNVIHLGGETSSITDGFKYNEKAHIDRTKFHEKWAHKEQLHGKTDYLDTSCIPKLGFIKTYLLGNKIGE